MMKDETAEPFKGKTFVFTGEMKMPRDEAKSKVVILGGRCTILPSSRTSYIVAGDEPGPSKMKKASELGIQVLKEDEFVKMIEDAMAGLSDSSSVDLISDESSDEVIERGHEKKTKQRFGHDIRTAQKEVASRAGIKSLTSDAKIDMIDNGSRNAKHGIINHTSAIPQMLCEKYRPKTKEELVGNKGIINQLEDFMLGKTQHRAALLSGSPGVGKTTAVYVIANKHNLNLIEFNASDVRNKREIQKRVRGMIDNRCISNKGVDKAVLLMDEIDGMTSDRGGLPELNDMMKKSKITIVCICNDRNSPKIRTIAGNCLDLRFRKWEVSQILPRIKEILLREKKQINDGILRDVILVSNGDMRYALNIVQSLLLRDKVGYKQASELVRKNAMKGIFDIVGEVFHRKSMNEKTDLYFEDYSLVPVFVAENYVKLSCPINEMYTASESISFGDIVDKRIRGSAQEYSLLPLHAFFSSVYPTRGRSLNKRIDFPAWLGQNSKAMKNWRNLIEIQDHGGIHFNGSTEEFRMYVLGVLACHYLRLLEEGKIEQAIGILVRYDLLQEDMAVLVNLTEETIGRYKSLKASLKSSLTREYKKLKRNLPYSVEGKKAAVSDEEWVVCLHNDLRTCNTISSQSVSCAYSDKWVFSSEG